MKQMIYCALAVALLAGSSCKRNEDGTTELMSAEEVAEKTQETAIKVAEKTEAVTVKAEEVMNDLNMTVADIKKKVASYDVTKVTAYADTYKDVILQKKDEIAGLTEKVKGLSMSDALGEKGKAIKEQLEQYTAQFDGLKKRYSVYLDKLKEFGVDLSAYGL